jgi:hypothetical protein
MGVNGTQNFILLDSLVTHRLIGVLHRTHKMKHKFVSFRIISIVWVHYKPQGFGPFFMCYEDVVQVLGLAGQGALTD